MEEMTKAAAHGVTSVMATSPLIAVLVLVILALVWFVRLLLLDAKEERARTLEAYKASTALIAEMKEMIRGAITK